MRITNRLALLVTAFAPLVMVSAPADAAVVTVTVGAVVFDGDVTLPNFPCQPNCGATGTPNETNPLVFVADNARGACVKARVSAPPPDARVTACVVTGLTARVFYSEPACIAGEALLGTATGTATITGTDEHILGTEAALPVTVPFQWQRVGLVAVVASNPLTNVNPAIVGAAVFVPTGGAPSCTGAPLTATVAGAAVLVDLSATL